MGCDGGPNPGSVADLVPCASAFALACTGNATRILDMTFVIRKKQKSCSGSLLLPEEY